MRIPGTYTIPISSDAFLNVTGLIMGLRGAIKSHAVVQRHIDKGTAYSAPVEIVRECANRALWDQVDRANASRGITLTALDMLAPGEGEQE